MKDTKQIVPYPFHVYFSVVIVLTLVGLFDSIYLAISHYRVYTDIGYKSFCAISKSLNCDTVSQSAFSIFLNIPVPVWGIIGYLFFLIVAIFAGKKQDNAYRLWSLLFVVALVFSLYSTILAFISTYYIHSYCVMCILSYGVNFGLLYFAWLVRRRFEKESLLTGITKDVKLLSQHKTKSILTFLIFIALLFSTKTVLPEYWVLEPPVLSNEVSTGITDEGHPWIGAENPELTIIEFTDYLCFQCKKMHFYLRQLVAQAPDKVRLVHRNFPMDHEFNPKIVPEPFHVGAGKLAVIANYAITKDKFWETNDVLYDLEKTDNSIKIKQIAEKIGLDAQDLGKALSNKSFYEKVIDDIKYGNSHKINATPSYIIDASVYTGTIPPKILKKIIK